MRGNKKPPLKSDKPQTSRGYKRVVVGYSRKTALLEEAITQMNAGKYGRSSAALKELLALDPHNMEARRLFATLHLRLGSLIPARQAFDALINEAFQRQDYWLAESLLREYLAAGPRCVPFLEKLGELYQEKGDALEAVAEYGKAIDIVIEDSDLDNPHHASELYAKIRALAPASPVAFRLSSFFDAQTGELLARQSSDSGQSTVAPSLDMSEVGQSVQASLEPMDGVMPWEIQDPQAEVPDVLKAADVSDSPVSGSLGSLIPPTITNLPVPQGPTLDGEVVSSDPPLREQREQTTSSPSEARGDAPEEPHAQRFESVPSGVQMDDRSGQDGLGSSHPFDLPSANADESSETQSGPDPAVSTSNPVAAQEQDRLLVEAEPEVLYDVSDSTMVSEPAEPVNASELPMISTQSIEAAGVMPSFQIEEISASACLSTEPSTARPIEAEDRRLSLQQPVEANSKEMTTKLPPDTRASSSPELGLANEISELWKQPGFSWESVFNNAWKFGNDHSAHVSPSEVTQPNVEESPIPPQAASLLREPLLENQAVEIPEREASTSLGDQTSSGSPIAPMPWDQVQESVISILPTEPDQPIAESMESPVDRSTGEADSDLITDISEDQAQPPISPVSLAAEMETFSIAPALPTPVSPEPEIPAADVRPASSQTERDFTFVEPEQALPAVSSLTMDELPLEAPIAAVASLSFENRPAADDVVVPLEGPPKSVDSALSTDDDRAIPAAQSAVRESSITPSQPTTSETLSKETEEIPVFCPLQTQQTIREPQPEIATIPDLTEEPIETEAHEQQPQSLGFVEKRTPILDPVPEPASEQEEWGKARDSIRFIEPPQPSPIADVPSSISERQEVGRSMSVAAAAVDVLFESSRNVRASETCEPIAESKPGRKSSSTLSRARIAIAGFVSSCFSTTRAVVMACVGLVMLSGVLIALGIGAIGLTWVIMEKSPSPAFQRLTTTPQRTLFDFKKNGYFLLLGIDASVGHDPIQAGYDRKLDTNEGNSALACFGGSESRMTESSNASVNIMRGWVRSSDPVGEFKAHQETIKGWGNQHQLALNRYGQWQKLPFEDWGYGQSAGPPCTAMVFAHQLHVADGFLQGVDLGVDRLEADMDMWRIVLGQARTLAMKMLALQAINDDIAVASGLLVRSDFDGKYLGRISKFLRPLDQVELSMRWPMQSELVSASKTYQTQLKAARAEEQPVYTMVASALPLPVQRRLNDYAEYYDASYKAAGEGRYGSLPKWKNYIHFPASGLTDYFTNPIENIIGLEPLAPWDRYNGFVVDTDAHLRLASLQAWLRRGSLDGDLLTRIAKAGQGFYDPYTGLPMLVNMKKGLLYSVGQDGKDQDADPQSDVVVEIPALQTSAAQVKSSIASPKSR
ncbi:MAG TPA: tetratricopeptide repeat protein [Nitrospira sp.]|nr:tetratricopeptide repeat protein [Nitrospira sp.]